MASANALSMALPMILVMSWAMALAMFRMPNCFHVMTEVGAHTDEHAHTDFQCSCGTKQS